MEICDNNADGLRHIYNQLLARGRKVARRTKPAKVITLKKPPISPKITSSPDYEKKKRKSHCGRDDDSKKRRMSVISGSVKIDEYESLGRIREGSYGAVYKVREKRTGDIFAVKEEFDGLSPTTFMEIDLLKSLGQHPCIVGFKKVVVDEDDGVYVVMEYMDTDLQRYISAKKEKLGISEVKNLMKQLVQGVKFLHDNNVMHRDLKTSNILVNAKGELKICDFGLSTRFVVEELAWSCVGTLGYRAPEVLEGMKYSCAVDMWAVGCIMGEMVLKKALFKGRCEFDQYVEIGRAVGSVDEDHEQPSSGLRNMFASADSVLSEAGFDLLHKLLSYDPTKRITAEDALNHAWFIE